MKAHVFRYLTVFEVQIHLLSTQKRQKALKVTPVIDSYHGFCSAAEFLRESGEKGSAVTRREGAGQRGQPGDASTALGWTNMQICFTVTRQQVPQVGKQA